MFPDMMFFNFFIMSNPGKSWPIRNRALIISFNHQVLI